MARDIELEARINALEHIVACLYAVNFLHEAAPLEALATSKERLLLLADKIGQRNPDRADQQRAFQQALVEIFEVAEQLLKIKQP